MATTTNYGWTTPDDTALVKDGAAAIRTLGSSVDTSVKALSPGTTAGDIDYYTTSTAKARLGIGSTGQVLTVAGGVPSWATASSGGMTLLSTTTLSGASTTISSISGSYVNLFMTIYGVTWATGNGQIQIAPNGTTNITTNNGYRFSPSGDVNGTSEQLLPASINSQDRTSAVNAITVQINNYASAASNKTYSSTGFITNATPTVIAIRANGAINTSSAITSLVFTNSGGNFSTGTVLLYGVK